MSENQNNDLDSIVDGMLDDGEEFLNHSQETDTENQSLESETAAPEEKDFINDFDSDSAQDEGNQKEKSTPQERDSVQEEKVDLDAEIAALRAENENLKKRFHDTQQAMHKANNERAELQRKLEAQNKVKVEDDDADDDWFKDSDNDKVESGNSEIESVKENIKQLQTQQEEYQQELRRQKWLDEAEKFAKDKEDFEELVYKKLEPLLDEETGDAMLRMLYMQQEDKSPAGAYNFAKKFFGYKEKLNTIAKEETTTETKKTNQYATGKAGLDRINSAEFSEPKRFHANVVDEIFG
jgi:chromosome segregation ATPase